MRFDTLSQWLYFLEHLYPVGMDLTLERIALVADRMGLRDAGTPRTVIVAGTNGKGTVATRTAALLRARGWETGLFTSPHLLRYNERIGVNGVPASDPELCRAFDAVDRARGDDPLTYFEFGALAAAWLFRDRGVAAQVLEVGLGGRLDAVNIWDADVAVITAVDLDHQKWLGDSREAIGREKAGIMRHGRPVILGETEPPGSVLEYAEQVGARPVRAGRDFRLERNGAVLRWTCRGETVAWQAGGPAAHLDGAALMNAATALAVVETLEPSLRLPDAAVSAALATTGPGRLQRVRGAPEWLLDVAHNPHAVQELARWLDAHPVPGPVVALVGIMADKERAAMWECLAGRVARWIPIALDLPRALPAMELAAELQGVGERDVRPARDTLDGIREAVAMAAPAGRVLVFGSFHTLAAVLEAAPDLAEVVLSGQAETAMRNRELIRAV
ncbi:MAG: bifunctional folylpolyglutamate synthase/dihydrofolate synthase [Thioalkalivibrio sp.]|nr:bifunctional folylpolyglutamate synthase/dihydrofolate synthase [Thioalkalivibrio sp.]